MQTTYPLVDRYDARGRLRRYTDGTLARDPGRRFTDQDRLWALSVDRRRNGPHMPWQTADDWASETEYFFPDSATLAANQARGASWAESRGFAW